MANDKLTAPPDVLHPLLTALGERYQALAPQSGMPSEYAERHASLTLAQAALRNLNLLHAFPDFPRQIAVIGPTQVGKSTLVNVLLGQIEAEVSPLAGFTTQPQGFSSSDADIQWLTELLPGRTATRVDGLSRDNLNHFGFMQSASSAGFENTIIWDTPDFDSLSSQKYRNSVLEIIAMADIVVLVLSKEKYSDLSVWKTLELMLPLQRELFVCLNKVDDNARAAVEQSLLEKLDAAGASNTTLITLPAQIGLDQLKENELPAGAVELRAALQGRLQALDRNYRAAAARIFIQQHWDVWHEPVLAEQRSISDWQKIVQQSADAALESYQRDYLDNSERYETFKRAIAQLLILLEIPGLSQPLTSIRGAITWPIRQLVSFWPGDKSPNQSSQTEKMDNELSILTALSEQLLTAINRELTERIEAENNAIFALLKSELTDHHGAITEKFSTSVRTYHAEFEAEINATANQLYALLKQRPAMLNSLRAARVTADASGIAFALKTGGIGVSDLLLAPAMLSLTSMLTEGALGSYMSRISDELKHKQMQTVEEQLFNKTLANELLKLSGSLDRNRIFGIQEQQMAEARQALESWR